MRLTSKSREIKPKDDYFFQNVVGISVVEFFWGLGLPVVVESTFLQLFLKKLGASSLAISLIPTLFFIGSSIFALLSSYLTSFLTMKRTAVIILHLVSSASLLLFGAALYFFGTDDFLLTLFFMCYGLFCICIGMTLPAWLSYLVNIFSVQKAVAGLGYMNVFQNIAKLTSSLMLLKIVETYAFSMQSAALVFVAVGVLFGVGSIFFLLTKEFPPQDAEGQFASRSFWKYTFHHLRNIIKNRNYLLLLAADLEFFVVGAVISFYANYAVIHCGIDPAIAAGLFVACIYIGAVASNLLMGSFGVLDLKNKAIFSKIMSICAIVLLIFFRDQWSFLLCSLLLGVSRGMRMIVMTPAVKQFSGLSDPSIYYALGPILTLPIAVGLPTAAGFFLDHFMGWGADAYRLVFSAALLLLAGTLLFLLRTDFTRH